MKTTTPSRIAEVFRTFLVLGLTSFGGPIAHLALFRRELVAKRAWVDEASYAQLVAFCQFMPGPTSSQVGFLIGYQRAGVSGAILAWCGFTLPAAAALTTAALLLTSVEGSGLWLWGMKAAVLAVVAQAVLAMIRSLCPDAARASIAAGVAAICLLSPFAWMQVAALVPAGLAGLLLSVKQAPAMTTMAIQVPSRRLSLISLGILAVLIFLVITAAQCNLGPGATLSAACFQAGGLVFGGGHVVLPLLREPIVQSQHLLSDQVFLTGYGAAQTVPGPLFTVAAWIGAKVGGIPLAALALVSIFIPGLLLVLGGLRYYKKALSAVWAQRVVLGLNAGVVGLLGAALWNPIGVEAIHGPATVVLALAAFLALEAWRIPAWAVVIGCCAIAVGGSFF
jgi:chromate transporter